MFRVDERSISFMRDCADYTGCYKSVADWIEPYISGMNEVYEVGCGIGRLSVELAHCCRHITAIDNNALAVTELKDTIHRRTITNVTALCADAFELHDTGCDALVSMRFGSLDELDGIASRVGAKLIIIIARSTKARRFCMEADEHALYGKSGLDALDGGDRVIDTMDISLDMGQPFSCMEDAQSFFELYSFGKHGLSDPLEKLIRTGNSEFPLYYPAISDFTLYVLRPQSPPGRT
ncbi:MAG TPA: class I SAM-dependent methyltransferase [Eubacteriales bacterium]|nr:class I SAM-dependent methyltransferase [Eubacteriales bacterium]